MFNHLLRLHWLSYSSHFLNMNLKLKIYLVIFKMASCYLGPFNSWRLMHQYFQYVFKWWKLYFYVFYVNSVAIKLLLFFPSRKWLFPQILLKGDCKTVVLPCSILSRLGFHYLMEMESRLEQKILWMGTRSWHSLSYGTCLFTCRFLCIPCLWSCLQHMSSVNTLIL